MVIHDISHNVSSNLPPIIGKLVEKTNEYISLTISEISKDGGKMLETQIQIPLNDIIYIERTIDPNHTESRTIDIDNNPTARISIPNSYYLYENPNGSICLCYKPNTKVSVVTTFGKLVGYFGYGLGDKSKEHIILVNKNKETDKKETLKIPLDIIIHMEVIESNH